MDRRLHAVFAGAMVAMFALMPALTAQSAEPPVPEVIFRAVRVFDGKSATMSGRTPVLVRGNTIAAVGAGAIPERSCAPGWRSAKSACL